ncbi:protein KHNYN [Paroedura picta]|uniref:protein KHNYN n=1 Tax=Paroedura picta TaxID=143630 RepID=UPI004056FD41
MPSGGMTLDEFAVPEEAQEMMMFHRPRIEQLFRVELNVLGVLGLPQSPNGEPQGERKIWLQLRGCRENLQRAKEYIKGLCAPELKEEVWYPKDMQCVFLGAQGLFLDCLTHGTSADLTLLRPGTLLASGLAEAFVMAQSRIQDFVEKYKRNPKLDDEREAQVKRAFQELVEAYDDKYAMDLLILPTAVKEELLNLVKEVREEEQEQRNGGWSPPGFRQVPLPAWEMEMGGGSGPQSPGRPPDVSVRGQSRLGDSDFHSGFARPQPSLPKPQGSPRLQYPARPGDARADLTCVVARPQERTSPQISKADPPQSGAEARLQDCSAGLNGPQDWLDETASLRRTLPKSSPQPIPAAPHKSPLGPVFPGPAGSLGDHREEGKPPFRVRESSPVSLPEESSEEELSSSSSDTLFSSGMEKEFRMRLNFFKTMGYEEQLVKKVLLEGGVKEAPSTILDRVQMEEAGLSKKDDGVLQKEPRETERSSPPRDEYLLEVIKAAVANCGHSPSKIPTGIQTGAPLADLLRQLNENGGHQDEPERAAKVSTAKEERGGDRRAAILNPDESSPQQGHQETGRNQLSPFGEDVHVPPVNAGAPVSSPDRPLDANSFFSTWNSEGSHSAESSSPGSPNTVSVSTVTGAQRFEEALKTRFKLKLADTPGNKTLRRVIIDGSNVAMMHGLNQFFSCRGIALAVQYFWDHGHREVTVFVPAYRMEPDSCVREQHFLLELRELNILSITPSRKVDGKSIMPYDDRLMLKLAEETNGIIVTNDQFRDLAKESKKWIRIIKERVLQYTFVENIFMVPDDPLGRSGPPLMEFLKKTPRTKPAKCHTFAGRATQATVPVRPASQTEVLHLRDRWPAGGSAGDRPRRLPRNRAGEEKKEAVRSVAETEQLRRELLEIFENQDRKIDFVLQRNPSSCDLNTLSEAVLSLGF